MNNMSLVDLFDLYDQAFEEVCDDLGVVDRPLWQHRWFYRFYQINFIPYYLDLLNNRRSEIKEISEKNLDEFQKSMPDSRSLKRTYQRFYHGLLGSFTVWWYKTAWHHFSHGKEKIYEFMSFNRDGYFSKKDRILWANKYDELLFEYNQSFNFPDQRVIFLPLLRTKEETVKLFEKYLNETGFYGKNANHPTPNVHISKNKVSEKSVKDCYRLLEYRTFNTHSDLVDIALNSGIKKTATLSLDIKNPRDIHGQSLNSVKAGMAILNKQALNLLYGSSIGNFPSSCDWIGDFSNNFEFHNQLFIKYYENNPKWLFNLARKKIPQPENMYDEIRKEILSLGVPTTK